MASPFILFVLFAVLAAGGVGWIAYAERGWKVAVTAVAVTLVVFIALAAGVLWLLAQAPGR